MAASSASGTGIAAETLIYEAFQHRHQLSGFSCGNKGLDDFILNDDEVFSYQSDFKSRTWLVREMRGWEVVAYYATFPWALHQKHVKKVPRIRPNYVDHYWPALTIGRLAVQEAWQGRGIGSHVVNKIAVDAMTNDQFTFRLLVLAAEPASVPFYDKLGFQMVDDTKNKGKKKPLMFLDLKSLAEHLGIQKTGGFPAKRIVD